MSLHVLAFLAFEAAGPGLGRLHEASGCRRSKSTIASIAGARLLEAPCTPTILDSQLCCQGSRRKCASNCSVLQVSVLSRSPFGFTSNLPTRGYAKTKLYSMAVHEQLKAKVPLTKVHWKRAVSNQSAQNCRDETELRIDRSGTLESIWHCDTLDTSVSRAAAL